MIALSNMNIVHLLGRVLLASMFFVSALMSGLDGLKGSTALIASKNLPFPFVLALLGFVAKLLGSVSLITNTYTQYGVPLLILFLIIVIVLFNNPVQDPSKKYMFSALVSVLGGLILSVA